MWPKPENPGDVFLTKENDSTVQEYAGKRLVGYTVSPASRFIMHLAKFRTSTTIRFTGMDK